SYTKLREVCHAGESLLSCLRDGRLKFTPEIASALLSMVDSIRQILGCIETTRAEGTADYAGLVANLTRLFEGAPPPGAAPPPNPGAVAAALSAKPAAEPVPAPAAQP